MQIFICLVILHIKESVQNLGVPISIFFNIFCGQLRCMTALKLAAVQRKVKNMRQTQAEEFHQKCLTRRAWNYWLVRCEECEELRLFHLTKRAQSHYRYNNKKYCEEMIYSESRKEEDCCTNVQFSGCTTTVQLQFVKQNL